MKLLELQDGSYIVLRNRSNGKKKWLLCRIPHETDVEQLQDLEVTRFSDSHIADALGAFGVRYKSHVEEMKIQ